MSHLHRRGVRVAVAAAFAFTLAAAPALADDDRSPTTPTASETTPSAVPTSGSATVATPTTTAPPPTEPTEPTDSTGEPPTRAPLTEPPPPGPTDESAEPPALVAPDDPVMLNAPQPATIFEDATSTITGALSPPAEGLVVMLDRRQGTGAWQRWQSATTTADGTFRFSVRPQVPATWAVRARSVSQPGDPVSEERQLVVRNRAVSIRLARSYVTYGDVVARGSVLPRTAARRVIVKRRAGPGEWRYVGTVRTRSDGGYRLRMPNRYPGPWRVRAWWPGAAPQNGTSELSGVDAYQVHAVLHPLVTQVTRRQLGGSYHDGCPVGPASLRNVQLTFKTYDPRVNRGTLVVHSSIVDDVRAVWGSALQVRFPFAKIRPTAVYGGSDIKAMYHDNTSAFNCRHVTGDPTSLSPHSYGTAIDINTVRNPYMDSSGRWYPRTKGASYRDRSRVRPGMLFSWSDVTEKLRGRGYQWGGNWSHKDYQHFDPY